MFRVYLNPKEQRVLISRFRILEDDWVLISTYQNWEKAYKKAAYIANKLDYVLEWYLEDQVEQALQVFKN
ncbi:MAG: hypothetical protein ABWK05_09890 [Pyrobaculum sp.]